MPYCFDAKLIDKELGLTEGFGFNCLRVVLPYVVWEHEVLDPGVVLQTQVRYIMGIADEVRK